MFAKKSLGQNFLKSKAALRAMVEAAGIGEGGAAAQQAAQTQGARATILEIGPGKGALTRALLDTGTQVIALEKDDRLIPILLQDFKTEIAESRLQILHTDALTFDPSEIANKYNYKIVANIPYYITGAFFKHYLTSLDQPKTMIVMVQKEVADRIVARDGKESLLSLSIKCYGTPRKIMNVKKEYFSPEPKVDSAIIAVENISRDFFANRSGNYSNFSEERFFVTLKAGFAHKRKVLIANLQNLSQELSREKLEKIFTKLNIPLKARAEDVALPNWREIAREIF